MQLRDARLCLDCEEVHDAQQCPLCASERFSFITRWVSLSDGEARTREETSPRAETFRQLIDAAAAPPPPRSRVKKVVSNGAFGLAAVGLLGWLWRSSSKARAAQRPSEEESAK